MERIERGDEKRMSRFRSRERTRKSGIWMRGAEMPLPLAMNIKKYELRLFGLLRMDSLNKSLNLVRIGSALCWI